MNVAISADDLQALIFFQIEGAISAANQYGANAEDGPVVGSQFDLEMNHCAEVDVNGQSWDAHPVKSALSLAGVDMQATGHFLQSLGQLLRPGEPLSLFGFQVVARSCVEAAARAWWLLEPTIGARERVARAMTEQANSIAEQDGAEKASGEPGGNASNLLVNLRARGAQLGLTEQLTKSGKLHGFERVMRPSSTQAVKNLLTDIGLRQGEMIYRFYSGITHALSYAVLQNFEFTSDGKGGQTVRTRLDFRSVGNAAVLGLSSYLVILERSGRLHGREVKALESTRLMRSGAILTEIAQISARA